MERVALYTRLRVGKEEAYERAHAVIPPDVDAMLRRNGVRSWRIFRHGRDLFHYVEVESYTAFCRGVENDAVNIAWQERMAEFAEVAVDYEAEPLRFVWELPAS